MLEKLIKVSSESLPRTEFMNVHCVLIFLLFEFFAFVCRALKSSTSHLTTYPSSSLRRLHLITMKIAFLVFPKAAFVCDGKASPSLFLETWCIKKLWEDLWRTRWLKFILSPARTFETVQIWFWLLTLFKRRRVFLLRHFSLLKTSENCKIHQNLFTTSSSLN